VAVTFRGPVLAGVTFPRISIVPRVIALRWERCPLLVLDLAPVDPARAICQALPEVREPVHDQVLVAVPASMVDLREVNWIGLWISERVRDLRWGVGPVKVIAVVFRAARLMTS
jgi:hypothetical protein